MVVDSYGNGNEAECTECEPPRRFKSKAGLNGHTQFKHGHLPDSRALVPNGKQSQMYQDLTDRVNQVLDRQNDIFDHLTHSNGNGNGNGQGNGNGNGQGNGNGNGQGNGNGNNLANGNGNNLANGNGNGQGNGNGNGLAMANGNGLSDERIGIASPHPMEDETPRYFCLDCKGTVTPDDSECPRCEEELKWSGLT